MKKFIIKSLYYLVPILILHLFVYTFQASHTTGDLLRIGHITNYNSNYREIFDAEYNNKLCISKVLDNNVSSSNDVFSIGDSFSQQGVIGYQNYLCKNYKLSVLHFDEQLNSGNPIEDLYGLVNGDFFKTHKVKYIILQSVERSLTYRGLKIDTTKIITHKKFHYRKKNTSQNKQINKVLNFPSDKIIKIPYYISKYYFIKDDCKFNNQVYRAKTTKQLFTNQKKEILFYFEDIKFTKTNNEKENILTLNKVLNNLSQKLLKKGIKLILLPSPDKYDLYYDYIVNNNDNQKYPKPFFFDLLRSLNKKYLYIDTKSILSQKIKKNQKDIYYYDDTHWSPWAAKIVAKKIDSIIKNN